MSKALIINRDKLISNGRLRFFPESNLEYIAQVFKRSDKNEVIDQSYRIWPIATRFRISPIRWTNQSLPRRKELGTGARRGKNRTTISKIVFCCAFDWLKERLVHSSVRGPCLMKFTCNVSRKLLRINSSHNSGVCLSKQCSAISGNFRWLTMLH